VGLEERKEQLAKSMFAFLREDVDHSQGSLVREIIERGAESYLLDIKAPSQQFLKRAQERIKKLQDESCEGKDGEVLEVSTKNTNDISVAVTQSLVTQLSRRSGKSSFLVERGTSIVVEHVDGERNRSITREVRGPALIEVTEIH
jgi:hypothetical protein